MKARDLLLGVLLVVPLASASSAEGAFTVERALFFPQGSRAEGDPLAIYLPETVDLTRLRVYMPRATVFEYQTSFCGVQTGVLPPVLVECGHSEQSWNVTNAYMTLQAGNHSGFLGIYTVPEATLGADATGRVSWEARAVSDIGNSESATGDPQSSGFYHQRIVVPHVKGVGNGSLDYQGAGGLKLRGPDVEISSSNLTRHETGKVTAGSTRETMTVLFVRLDAPATLTLGGAPFQAALSRVEAAWDGVLRFNAQDGSLHAEEGTYLPTRGATELDGRFSGRLAPLGGASARLELAGELRATSMIHVPAPVGLVEGERSWLAWVLLGTVVGAAGGAAIWRQLHRRATSPQAHPMAGGIPFTAEDCREAGAFACTNENWAVGAEWFERALKLAPTSARLHADLAFCLSQINDIERAMAHFRKAHELSTDGESAFNAACAAAFHGGDEEASRWLKAALERSPEYVIGLRDDDELSHLLERPDVALVEHRAWEQLRAEGRGPPGTDAEP